MMDATHTPGREYIGQMNYIVKAVLAGSDVGDYQLGVHARKKDYARIPHLEWVAPQVLEQAQQANGFRIEWRSRLPATAGEMTGGRIKILPIMGKPCSGMYSDWAGGIYLKDEPRTFYLKTFKVLDMCADDACVGLFHDERTDPQLYQYRHANGPPRPLGLDWWGYFQLLRYTLGFYFWQDIVNDLAEPGSVRPYRPDDPQNQKTVAGMERHLPHFNLDEFVALFDRVRLSVS